jgi:hypothetical protein
VQYSREAGNRLESISCPEKSCDVGESTMARRPFLRTDCNFSQEPVQSLGCWRTGIVLCIYEV